MKWDSEIGTWVVVAVGRFTEVFVDSLGTFKDSEITSDMVGSDWV